MFSRQNMIALFWVSVAVAAVARYLDGWYVGITDTWTVQLHLEFIWTCALIASVFFIVMLLLGFLFLNVLGIGTGSSDPKNEKLVFTKNELLKADQEDEPWHNESQRQTASASWQGGSAPVYTDYRGYVRNAFTDEAEAYNQSEDKRRVINGHVSKQYVKNADGQYVASRRPS